MGAWDRGTRVRAVRMVVGLGVISAFGCGPLPSDEGSVAVERAGLEHDFSKNAPSITTLGPAGMSVMAERKGFGADADQVIRYSRMENKAWTVDSPTDGLRSRERPTMWWEDMNFMFATLFNDPADGKVKDINDVHFTVPTAQRVFPTATSSIHGPVSAVQMRNGHLDIFGRFWDGKIRQSYITTRDAPWGDLPLSTPTPNTGPLAINRSSQSDSLWFGCGPEGTTQVCEFRISDGGAFNFTTDLGAGSFEDGTRPTAISNFESADKDRWVFGSVLGANGTHWVYARRELSTLDSLSVSTFDSTVWSIDSSLSAVFSTPVPYIRADGKTAVMFFKTDGVQTTKLLESVFSNGSWTFPQQIHDAGMRIVPGNEPVPFVDATTKVNGSYVKRNSVLFRLPMFETTNGTALLTQLGSNWYKELLPESAYVAGLGAITGDDLSHVDADTGTSTPRGYPDVWPNTSAFTSDRHGLGYAFWDGSLWEVNLNDGVRRKLGTRAWGTTNTLLTYGHDQGVPTLWTVEGDRLLAIDVATGVASDRGGTWTGATALTFNALGYVIGIVDGTMRKADTHTGTVTNIGLPSEWAPDTLLTSDGYQGWLYAYQTNFGTVQIDPGNGSWFPKDVSPQLIAYPIRFENTKWKRARSTVTPDRQHAPDWTFTGDDWRETTGTGTHSIEQVVTADPTKIYTWSLYLKPNARKVVQLFLSTPEDNTVGVQVVVDLTSGAISEARAEGSAFYVGTEVSLVTNGYYHVRLTGRPTSVAGSRIRAVAYMMTSTNPSSGSYTGDGSSGLYLWGGELHRTDDIGTWNLAQQPKAIDNAVWTKARSTVPVINSSAVPAPDGTSTAELVTENTATGAHGIYQNMRGTDPTRNYTWSAYVKPNGRSAVMLMLDSLVDPASTVTARFDLTGAGSVFATSNNGTAQYVASSVTALANGWYRVSLTGRATTAQSNQLYAELLTLPNTNPLTSAGYTGNGTGGIYVWGAMVRGNLNPSSSSPIKRLVELKERCTPDTGLPDNCKEILYTVRQNGELARFDTMRTGTGSVLGYQVLASTWPTLPLLVPRDY